MGKVDAKKKKKQDALFNTAFELFTSKGIQKTSISDIVENAGVGKGTFYLYFKDKYDIRNKLITHKTSELFTNAHKALLETDITELEDKLIFIVDYIIGVLASNKPLLSFIAKNLSWGVFQTIIDTSVEPKGQNFYNLYLQMLKNDEREWDNPDLMLFTILELVSGSCYSIILNSEPVSLEEYKPYLYQTLRNIIRGSEKS